MPDWKNKMTKRTILVLTLTAFFFTACVPVSNEGSGVPVIDQTTAKTERVTVLPAANTAAAQPPPSETPKPTGTLSPEDCPPVYAKLEFSTDFTIHNVPYTQIRRGGPSKDGIPAIDEPEYFTILEADIWLKENDPVIFIEVNGDGRAYPLQILVFHEIVNDEIKDVPITVTYCPLCNTGIAFERTLGNRVLDFGTTGRLRFSNLIMYDRQTETWWQQANGEAIIGELTGKQLTIYPAAIISWLAFKNNFPDGSVLSYHTGFDAPYGLSPYESFDEQDEVPFHYEGADIPTVLPPLERVLGINVNGESVAYPFSSLMGTNVVQDQVGGSDIVIFWLPDTFSVLDEMYVWESRNVGSAVAFENLEGINLHFIYDGLNFIDSETGSTWNFLGQALHGPLQGQSLKPLLSFDHFWFSWFAFYPETGVYSEEK